MVVHNSLGGGICSSCLSIY